MSPFYSFFRIHLIRRGQLGDRPCEKQEVVTDMEILVLLKLASRLITFYINLDLHVILFLVLLILLRGANVYWNLTGFDNTLHDVANKIARYQHGLNVS